LKAYLFRFLRPDFGQLFWFLFLLGVGPAKHAFAQQSGHYLQGITGLENGSTTPPGFYASFLPYVYDINSLKNADGATIVKPDLTLVAYNNLFSMTTDKKILGASYGATLIIPVVNTRLTADAFNKTLEQGGLSDIYLSPIVLGWTRGQANFVLNYGVYFPSGQFNPSSPVNPGLGFWEQQIQAGSTYSIDKKKLWNTSLLSTWEINQSKEGLDVKPGPMVTFEYSLGRRFFGYRMNAGVASYAYTKLSPDSGSGVTPSAEGVLDRSFGAGPEWKYTEPKWHMAFDVRYEPQFGVEAKTSGNVFVFSVTYLDFLIPKKKE
jgi:hypothetical protein